MLMLMLLLMVILMLMLVLMVMKMAMFSWITVMSFDLGWTFTRWISNQIVTNIFEYSNIQIFLIRIFIRVFVRIIFLDMNIFGYSFVSRF